MNKQLIISGIIVVLTIVGLSGCQEQTTTENLVTSSVIPFALTLNDIPDGFEEVFNATNLTSYLSTALECQSIESYSIAFTGNYSNQSVGIACFLFRFDSLESANTDYSAVNNYFIEFGALYEDIVEIISTSYGIGDESFAYSMYNATHIYFRISNVLCYIASGDNSLAVDFAELVEERINASL